MEELEVILDVAEVAEEWVISQPAWDDASCSRPEEDSTLVPVKSE
jgi:hypothetical protein